MLSFSCAAFAQQENESNDAQEESTTKTEPSADSSTPTKPVEIPLPTSLIDQYESDIKKSVDESLIAPLLIGTDDFLTITQPDIHSSDKGVAILLPDWGQAAVNPKAINFLRKRLPEEGWTTITIQPMEKPLGYPVHHNKPKIAEEENNKLLSDYQQQLSPMLTSVMEKAADYPGIFIVIAQGNNAAQLLNIYQQEEVEKPNALILLSAHLLTDNDNSQLSASIAESEIPILDLWLKKDSYWVNHFAKQRAMYAQKELKTYYRQRQLTNFNTGYYPEQALAKEIKGWLTTIGW